jgi:hypothetical protein
MPRPRSASCISRSETCAWRAPEREPHRPDVLAAGDHHEEALARRRHAGGERGLGAGLGAGAGGVRADALRPHEVLDPRGDGRRAPRRELGRLERPELDAGHEPASSGSRDHSEANSAPNTTTSATA